MIKLIACDLDGTLLPSHCRGLTRKTEKLIKSLLDRGVCFVAASGRSLGSEQSVFSEFGNKITYIADNGALCCHQGRLIYKHHINSWLCEEIYRKAKEYSNLQLAVYCEEGCFVENSSPVFIDYIKENEKIRVTIVEDLTQIKLEATKITLFYTGDNQDTLASYVAELSDFSREISQSGVLIMLTGNQRIDFYTMFNKGVALRYLMKTLDLKPEECMAFGDQVNDKELLSVVGHPYAMKKGNKDLHKIAGKTTASVDKILEEIIKEGDVG